MKKTILFAAILFASFAAFSQAPASKVNPAKQDTIPTLTITLPLNVWNDVRDIIMKTNVPTQQFISAYDNVAAVIAQKITEYNNKQPKK